MSITKQLIPTNELDNFREFLKTNPDPVKGSYYEAYIVRKQKRLSDY